MADSWNEYATNPEHVIWRDRQEAIEVADGGPLVRRQVYATEWVPDEDERMPSREQLDEPITLADAAAPWKAVTDRLGRREWPDEERHSMTPTFPGGGLNLRRIAWGDSSRVQIGFAGGRVYTTDPLKLLKAVIHMSTAGEVAQALRESMQ